MFLVDLEYKYVIVLKTLDLGCATGVKALRGTSVGDQELGWQLLVPTEVSQSA